MLYISYMNSDAGKPQNNSVDAILMCGEGKASHSVAGERAKALLKLGGKPLFVHVLSALEKSPSVKRIFIVGPKSRLDGALAKREVSCQKPVEVLEQKEDLLSNAWFGFMASLDGYTPGLEKGAQKVRDKMVLFLPGDAPLVTPAEIEEFIDAVDIDSFDYVVGLSPAESLLRFAKTPDQPGIDMASFHAREGLFRVNNLHMARPFAFVNRWAVQEMYNARYQKSVASFLSLLFKLLKVKEIRKEIWLYLLMQFALFFRRVGFTSASDALRRHIPLKTVMDGVGKILGLRAGAAITHCGAAAIDVDNDKDYKTMGKMFNVWREMAADYKPGLSPEAGETANV